MKCMQFIVLAMIPVFAQHCFAQKYLSVNAGYNYNQWNPNSIDQVEYNTVGLNGGFVELDSPYYRLMVNRPFFRYEWTPGDKGQQERIKLKMSESTALEKVYEHVLVYVPFKCLLFKYEKEVFIADLQLQEDKTYYPFIGDREYLRAGETITESVVFQEASIHFVGLFRKAYSHAYVAEDIYFGVSFGEYRKPYAMRGLGHSYIFDAKFDYFSLDLGAASPKPDHPGLAFVYDICGSIGSGDIELTKGLSLNDGGLDDGFFMNSMAVSGMLGLEYNSQWMTAALSLKARGRQHDLNRKLEYADQNGQTYERIGSLNKDSIFKVEFSLGLRF